MHRYIHTNIQTFDNLAICHMAFGYDTSRTAIKS